MTETGTNSGNAFAETVTGSDDATLTESGNPATDTFGRTITGTGTYDRTDIGPGATLSNTSGATDSYTLTESADVLGAVFSQSTSGTDRYGLLEHFIDVSNTGSGNTPGNMNFFPFGQPFVDPLEEPDLAQYRQRDIDRQIQDTIDQWEGIRNTNEREIFQVRQQIRRVEEQIRAAHANLDSLANARARLAGDIILDRLRTEFGMWDLDDQNKTHLQSYNFFDGLYRFQQASITELEQYWLELKIRLYWLTVRNA